MINSFQIDGHDFIRVICTSCGAMHDVPVYCGNRFCRICMVPRMSRVKRRLKFLIDNCYKPKGSSLKHLVLTLPNQSNLCIMLKKITQAFRKLRNRKLWKERVVGGAYTIEVTNIGNGWHVHLHVIMQSYYIDWQLLLAAWRKCSGGGQHIHISQIDASTGASYLAKYITKGIEVDGLEFEAGRELKAYRLFSPIGDWYKLSSKFVDIPKPCSSCGAERSVYPADLVYAYMHGGSNLRGFG